MTASTSYSNEPVAVPRRLHRARSDRIVAGVCSGIAEYLGVAPFMVRLMAVVVGLLAGILPLLVLYVIAALLIPEQDAPATVGIDWSDTSFTPAAVSGRRALILGGAFIIVGAAAATERLWATDLTVLGPVVLMGIGAALLLGSVSGVGNR